MAKAEKVQGIHFDCPACGIPMVIDNKTGAVRAYGKSRKADPPVNDPPPKGKPKRNEKDPPVKLEADPPAEPNVDEPVVEDGDSEWGRGGW